MTSSTSTRSQAPVTGSQSLTSVALPAREATRIEPSVSTVHCVALSSLGDRQLQRLTRPGGQGARPREHVGPVVGELGVDGPADEGVVALADARLGLRHGAVVEHHAVADVGDRRPRPGEGAR